MSDLGPFPDFSTSPSAAKRRHECARKHFLATYGAWGGWYTREEFAEKLPTRDYGRARTAYILKNAESRYSLVGKAIHKAAERHIRAARLGQAADLFEIRREAANHIHQVVTDAVDRKWMIEPKKTPAVRELLYKEMAAADFLAVCLDALPGLLETLEASAGLRDAIAAVRAGKAVEVEKKATIKVGQAVVWVIPDVAWVDDTGGWTILDWKTGKRKDEHAEQVGTYALAHAASGGTTTMRLVYLGEDPGERTIEAGPEDGEVTRQAILAETEACRALVVDGDLTRNEPLPIEAFPMLPENSRACRWCDFRRLCGRG